MAFFVSVLCSWAMFRFEIPAYEIHCFEFQFMCAMHDKLIELSEWVNEHCKGQHGLSATLKQHIKRREARATLIA